MVPRIAFMHHPRSFFALELFEQVAGTADILWVLSGPETSALTDPRLLRRLGEVVDIAGMGPDEAAEALDAYSPDGIVSFVDDHIENAAALAALLGLRYHTPEVARGVVDKRTQRELIDTAGISGPEFRVIPSGGSKELIESLAAELGFPFVLKAARGSGSRGIGLIRSPEELLSHPEIAGGSFVGIIEELLPDDPTRNPAFASYLSVESVVSGSTVSHVAVTGRFPLASGFRETGNFIPAAVESAEIDSVTTMAGQAIRAIGIEDSIVHTEIKLTPDGLMLIEVNGRLGGRPPFVLLEVSDLNLFQTACVVAAGTPVRFDGLVECDGVGFMLMMQPPEAARQVTSIDGLGDLGDLPEVRRVVVSKSVGDSVDLSDGTDAKVLTVQGRAPDIDGLVSTIASIERKVVVHYN